MMKLSEKDILIEKLNQIIEEQNKCFDELAESENVESKATAENAKLERDPGFSMTINNNAIKKKIKTILLRNPRPKRITETIKTKTSEGKHGSKNFVNEIINTLKDKKEITPFIERIESAAYNSNKNNHIIVSKHKNHSQLLEPTAFLYSGKNDAGYGARIIFREPKLSLIFVIIKYIIYSEKYFKKFKLEVDSKYKFED